MRGRFGAGGVVHEPRPHAENTPSLDVSVAGIPLISSGSRGPDGSGARIRWRQGRGLLPSWPAASRRRGPGFGGVGARRAARRMKGFRRGRRYALRRREVVSAARASGPQNTRSRSRRRSRILSGVRGRWRCSLCSSREWSIARPLLSRPAPRSWYLLRRVRRRALAQLHDSCRRRKERDDLRAGLLSDREHVQHLQSPAARASTGLRSARCRISPSSGGLGGCAERHSLVAMRAGACMPSLCT